MPGGMKSGPKNQRNILYGSLLSGPPIVGRTGTASVVRILTTEPSVLATIDVKSGIDSAGAGRSEEHTSELQSLMRISYAVFCLQKKKTQKNHYNLTRNRIISNSMTRKKILI